MSRWGQAERWCLVVGTLLLWAAFFHIAAATKGTYDTLRDAWFAASISSGHSFPMVGPGIFRTFHLGPLWFYILAVPALLGESLKAVVLTCSLLVALQFPLAWCLARRLSGRSAALVLVMLLFAPGWWFLSLPVLTHTAGVAASLMFLGLTLLSALQRVDVRRGLLLGLAVALAISAHPTNVLLCGVAMLAFLVKAREHRRLDLLWTVVAPVLVLMAPYLLLGGFQRDLGAISGYAGSLLAAETARDPLDLLRLLTQPLYAGAAFAWVVWGGLPVTVAGIVGVLPVALVLLCLLGSWRTMIPAGARRWGSWALLCLFMQVLLLWIVRAVTPFWMTFALTPLLAFALSVLVGPRMDSWSRRRLCVLAFVGLSLVTWLPSLLMLPQMKPKDGFAYWAKYESDSAGAMSVTSPVIARERFRAPPLSLKDYWRDPVLEPNCGERQALHGELAGIVDKSLGYAWIAGCSDSSTVSLGAARVDESVHHRFAVASERYQALCGDSISPETMLHELDVRDFKILSQGQGLPFADPYIYPPRSIPAAAPERTFQVSIDTSRWTYLMVVNLANGYYPFPSVEATTEPGGARTGEDLDDVRVYVLRPTDADGDATTFQIGFSPDYVDVVAFRCSG